MSDNYAEIFDQTFAITYALQIVAIIVAAIGVTNTLAALVVERGREIAGALDSGVPAWLEVSASEADAKRTRRPEGRSQATGDPTETALLEFAAERLQLDSASLRAMMQAHGIREQAQRPG